ncbi:MAG: hypothetical protein R6U57_10990 [Anaerolineales bacterium]
MGEKQFKNNVWFLFALTRLVLFLSLPLEGVRGYGDYWNFYHIADLGWPFLDHWVEFPPIFPLFSRLVYLVAGGKQHAYEYLLAFLLTGIQAGNLYIVGKIGDEVYPREETQKRILIYFALLVGLFYGWAYFEPLAVMPMLLGIYWLLIGKEKAAAVILGAGGLVKWFPLLVIPAIWKRRSVKKAFLLTLITLSVVVAVWGGLYLLSPDMTRASLASQWNKGSWETVWALVDGNLRTGNFGSQIDRKLPQTAFQTLANPPVIPSWLTLIIYGGLGLWVFFRCKIKTEKDLLSFIGLTLVIFFLWTPGYSPQWVLYVLPFTVLLLPLERSTLFSLTMVLVHILEWPILLSRGWFDSLWVIIPLRTLSYILLGIMFWEAIRPPHQSDKVAESEKAL